VDILVHILGHVVVDDMLDALDVEAARRHRRRHQDGEATRPEVAQRLLALTLQAVTCTHIKWGCHMTSSNLVKTFPRYSQLAIFTNRVLFVAKNLPTDSYHPTSKSAIVNLLNKNIVYY
jgi:hypothetical protein